jgi:thiopeptide-type bacteriocin biosynthesis protein
MAAADWFMLRTPALPFDAWLSWTSLADSADDGNEMPSRRDDYARTENKLRSALRQFMTPQFLKSIYLASPAMSAGIAEWLKNPDAEPGVEASLVAYFTRMAARPTPFGLFSSVSLGNVAATTNFSLSGEPRRLRTQIGLAFLQRLYREMLRKPEVRAVVEYVPNPTIRRLNGHLHYLKRVEVPEGKTAFAAATCRETPPLVRVLTGADTGITISELVSHKEDRTAHSKRCVDEISHSQTLQFIHRLIDSQILVPMIGPVVAGGDPTAQFIQQADHTGEMRAARTVDSVLRTLAQFDSSSTEIPVDRYEELAQQLSSLSEMPEPPSRDLFFVDSPRTAPDLSLGKAAVDEILGYVQLLSTISSHNDPTWDRFKEKFEERFGSEEIPLLDLFEADFDFQFDQAPASAGEWQLRESHLLRKVAETIGAQKTILHLSELDLSILRRPNPGKLPSSFAVLCHVLAASGNEINHGDYQVLINGISRTSALFGRFAGLGKDWQSRIEALAAQEQQLSGDAVLADVVYDPPGKPVTNVFCRPALTHYVIPFFGTTVAPREMQIRLSELSVSIRAGEIVLWSERLNKQVMPVHNTAYAFHHPGNPPVLRFLCKLAMGTSAVAWDWGRVLESFPFLPRLQYDRLIIAPARWKLQQAEFPDSSRMQNPELTCRIQELRDVHHIPRFVVLLHQDKRLPVDLENILSLKMFLRLTRHQDEITLTELLPAPEQLCAGSSESRFHHELVLPVTRGQDIPVSEPRARRSLVPVEQRRMLPASEWMYIKVYARPSLLDASLTSLFANLTGAPQFHQIASKWFFIRYADPAHHLRIRFHLHEPGMAAVIFEELSRHLNALRYKDLLWKWQVDTYEREIERYGGLPATDAAENIFCADSALALNCLQHFTGIREREEARNVLCLLSVDGILEGFGLTLSGKLMLMKELCEHISSGIENRKQLVIQFGMEMRSERRNILVAAARLDTLLSAHFYTRSSIVGEQASILRRLDAQKALTQPVSSLIKDFIHLSINRFKKVTKNDEWKLYDCLQRLYASCHGRGLAHLRELYAVQAAAGPSGSLCYELSANWSSSHEGRDRKKTGLKENVRWIS